MSIRIKFALFVLGFALSAAGYFIFYWEPQSERQSERTLISFTKSHLNTVAEGLVHPFLENRLASIRENLQVLLTNNPDWRGIELYDAEGRRLFPVKEQARPTGKSVKNFEHDVLFRGEHLGTIVLSVDFGPRRGRMRRQSHELAAVLIGGMFLSVLAIGLFIDLFVRRPTLDLVAAANRLAKGDFSTPLPRPRRDELGDLIACFASMRDSIQRHQGDLVESREQLLTFRRLAEASGQGLRMATLDGRITYANPNFCRMTGLESTKDFLGTHITDYHPQNVGDCLSEEIIPAVLRDDQWIGELAVLTGAGEIIETIENFFLIRDDAGKPLYLANVVTDITERKQAEKAMKTEQAEALVLAAYKALLFREPDARGQKTKVKALLDGLNLQDFLDGFVTSPESEQIQLRKNWKQIWEKRISIYRMEPDSCDFETLEKLFDKTAGYWRGQGGEENEIYYSVLSNTKNQKILSLEERFTFIRTGADFVNFCIEKMKESGFEDPANKKCLDFGCGVGRLSLNLAPSFRQIEAVDFSEKHLSVLRENARDCASNVADRIHPFYIASLSDFERLPHVDAIISYLVLQHNTPPVMAYILDKLLRALKPGGRAMIHIPIHHPFYSFNTEEYLQSGQAGMSMEMHMLPRENIRDVASEAGCTICDSYGYGGTKGVYSEVILFEMP